MIPLPEPTKLRREMRKNGGYNMVPAYTADQMHAYAAAAVAEERERICKWMEHGVDLGGLTEHPNWLKYTVELLSGCAAAIRAGGKA